MARIGYGGGGGLSRQPVKLDTASANFFAGMAGVQAMRQQQEKHEQELVQSEEKLQIARSADRRANRQLAIEEKQAYREETAFQAGAIQAGAKVTSWNGREMPRWGSRSLQGQWQTLDDMKRDIARRRNAGQDVTSQEIAFASLSTQYENLYASEKYKSDASSAATGVAGLYQELGLQPDDDIQQLLDGVMSAPPQGGEPGAVGPTATQVPPDAIARLQAEKRRLMQYRAERQQREALALDLGSMQEIFGQLRAGRVPEGFTIDQSLANAISGMAISDYDEGDVLIGKNHALMELHRSLSGAFVGDIDPWAVDTDVSKLAERVRRLKGLFGMLQNSDTLEQYNLQKDVEVRMQNERKMFQEREKMSATLEDVYRTEGVPDELMSPYMMFARVHRGQSLQSDGMQYDDSAEYGQLWKIVEGRLDAIGGPREEAIKILDQRWREGAQDREVLAQMPSFPLEKQRSGEHNFAYYDAVVKDIVGQTKQMNEKISSPVISDELLQVELTHPDDRSLADMAAGVGAQAVEGLVGMAASALQSLAGQTPTGLKHIGGRLYERYNSNLGGDQDEKIRVALAEAGISEEEFFDRQQGETGFSLFGESGPADPNATGLGRVIDRVSNIPIATEVEGRPMTILEFINRNPNRGARLLHALQFPKSVGGQFNHGRVADPDAEPLSESRRYADRGVRAEEDLARPRILRNAAQAVDPAGAERRLAEESLMGEPGMRPEPLPPQGRISPYGPGRDEVPEEFAQRPRELTRAEEQRLERMDRRRELTEPTGTGQGARRASEIGSGMEEYMRVEGAAGESLAGKVRRGDLAPFDPVGAATDADARAAAARIRRLPSTASFKVSEVETLDDFLRMAGYPRDNDMRPMTDGERREIAATYVDRLRRRSDMLLERSRSQGRSRGFKSEAYAEHRKLQSMISKVERMLKEK